MPSSRPTPVRQASQRSGDKQLPRKSLPSTPLRSQNSSPTGVSKRDRNISSRPAAPRRHTAHHMPPPSPAHGLRPSVNHRRTNSTPALSRGDSHVLIPVPIRARDAESPAFIRAPSGQRVDFVFPPAKKRGLIGRLLDSVEWGDPQENKTYQYRKHASKSKPASRPFYKKFLP